MGDPNRIGLVAYTEGIGVPSLDMDIPLDHPDLTIDDVLQHFRLEALPKMVTELTIRDTYLEDTPTKWFGMVPLFENLKVLNFTYCPPSTLTSMLSDLESKDLEVISFLTIPIIPRRRTEDDSEPSPELPLEVFEFFRGREATGLSLPKLIITKCRITRTCVDALRKYVTVDWDGLEDGGEEGMFRHFDPDFAQSLAPLDTSD
ncbi:hypothetical protein ONZ45_g18861 [Pleurotus djamor]|nr:hypothetical protein ONZ45_g18861 [Pleurotus djamor]